MQAVIVHPAGVEAGVCSAPAREAIDIAAFDLQSVILRSRNLTSAERLGIYASAYFARLLECLREEFPALKRAVGEEAFSAFAGGYLQQYPPQSYTLAELGSRFPQFLQETRPDDGEPRPNWTDFVIELATVERIYAEVFDGPGVEHSRCIQPEALAGLSPERWSEAQLVPAPCLRLVELSHPVHEYITAVRRKQNAIVPAPSPTWLVITRRDYVVRRVAVSRDEFTLLESLIDGRSVGEAIAALMRDSHEASALEARVQEWFRHWAAAGYFQAISFP
jgi:hypothetical protein